ncbi:MAG: sigma-54-dependent Fis family transcriptional regulator [Deltaproteobacteria bacterium]|nr:MAG: sigma-54-dependent Fis family transcriptional regulator [Deltaproteobacteria bacterium]
MADLLIVDDESNIRSHFASYVRTLGHGTELAASAEEALAALARRPFDIVFTDVRMAGMDGLALLKEIKRRAPETVVVLMTAYATVADAVEAMRAGAYDYLVKPFGLDQVRLVVERALELQAKLLRFLEEHRFERVGGTTTAHVDARVIAATNRDLDAEVAAGRVREDLYFRLNVVGIHLPALRERPEDLPALIDHILGVLAARHGRASVRLSGEARTVLESYRWPGNVRELINALERGLVLCTSNEITVDDLPDRLLAPVPARGVAVAAPSTSPPEAGESLEELEHDDPLAQAQALRLRLITPRVRPSSVILAGAYRGLAGRP